MLMKKIIACAAAISLLFAGGCGKKKAETPKKEKEPIVETAEMKNDVFYDMMQDDTRPVAVMIDNDVAASRPQMGLESAYMVYEITVEGGATRFMALFKEHNLEKVGPIRSSRHYFLDYALEHDAIYCHAGWSPQASRDISSLGVNNINGITGSDGSVYWRDNTYDKTWHNLYSGVDKLYKLGTEKKKYRGTTDVVHDEYHKNDVTPESGENAEKISLPYSNFYRVSYAYDSEKKNYKRYVNGSEHMSQTGNCLTAKNIIIYAVRNYPLNDGENKGRQNLDNIGSGSGKYITDGKCVNINWKKDSRKGKTVYTLEDGTPLVLNPGNTYVQIVPTDCNVGIESAESAQ